MLLLCGVLHSFSVKCLVPNPFCQVFYCIHLEFEWNTYEWYSNVAHYTYSYSKSVCMYFNKYDDGKLTYFHIIIFE